MGASSTSESNDQTSVVDANSGFVSAALLLPKSFGRNVMAFFVVATAIGLIWSFFDPQGQFFLLGMIACCVVTFPMTLPRYAVFSPWSVLASVIYVSCGVRGLFISLHLEGQVSIDSLFLLGKDPGFFLYPSLLYIVALALMVFGYVGSSRSPRKVESSRLQQFEVPQLIGVVVTLLAIVGLLGFFLYAQRTGGIHLDSLSQKRTTIGGLELNASYKSYGELRFMNSASAVAFWLYVAVTARRGRMTSARFVVGALLLINAVLLPFYASSRSEIALTLIVGFVIHYGTLGRLPRLRRVLRAAAVIVMLLAVVTDQRLTDPAPNSGTTAKQLAADAVGRVFVYNRNFGDMLTTSHVVNAVPDSLPYQYGKTITSWVVAPIPRAIWPEKPVLKSGPIIGNVIYGNSRSGVPPGFVAEMYWNYGIPAVLIGSLFLGVLMRRIQDRYVGQLRGSPMVAFFYAAVYLRLGANILTGGVGSGLFHAVSEFAIVTIALGLAAFLRTGRSQVPLSQ